MSFNSSLNVLMFSILFLNVYKENEKKRKKKTSNLLDLRSFRSSLKSIGVSVWETLDWIGLISIIFFAEVGPYNVTTHYPSFFDLHPIIYHAFLLLFKYTNLPSLLSTLLLLLDSPRTLICILFSILYIKVCPINLTQTNSNTNCQKKI